LLLATNLLFKHFYQLTKTIYPDLEKTSVLHPQNKSIKKSRHALLKYLRQLSEDNQSQIDEAKMSFSLYTKHLSRSLVSFVRSSYTSILTSRFSQNLASGVQASLKILIADGVRYFRGLFIFFAVDASIIDDEPLWEPIEWSMVQA